VRDLLARAGLADLPWSAVGSSFVEGRFVPHFPRAGTGCGRCGNCKGQHVSDHRARGYDVVLVGDGFSDRCGRAARGPGAGARGPAGMVSARRCARHAFEGFAEVAAITRDSGWLDGIADRDREGSDEPGASRTSNSSRRFVLRRRSRASAIPRSAD
jgi:hypothetical protein